MTDTLPSRIIAGIAFAGCSGGAVKTLGGFKKGYHTLPDAANATTNAFLGKICAGELTARAERLFQSVRAGLACKRRELALTVASPVAVLTAKNFTVEICYALKASLPAQYAVTTTLHSLNSAELARTAEFNGIFTAMFTELSFALSKGARVETLVDMIEALNGVGGLAVRYPSDCSECVISVAGVGAQVRCKGAALDMVFPQPGSPRDLMEEFAAVRGAFEVSRELRELIG